MIEAGVKCTVNNGRDLAMEHDAKKFIGKPCVVVKKCRSGLIQVALADTPKMQISVPSCNITLDKE